MKTLADRLKEARLKADKKQGDVAEADGIKQQTYQAQSLVKLKNPPTFLKLPNF